MADEGKTGTWDRLRRIKTVHPAWSDMVELLTEHGVIDLIPPSMELPEALGKPVLGEIVYLGLALGLDDVSPFAVYDLLAHVLDALAERTCDQEQAWTVTQTPKE